VAKTKYYKSQQDETVKAMLGDWPIKDAHFPFRCTVQQQDIEQAKRKDPHRCAVARTIKRYTGIEAIAIFHTIAYIPFDKNGDGKIIIERFSIDAPTQRAIAEFDETGKFPPGEYKFNPPSKSVKLGAQAAYLKRQKKNNDEPKQEVRGRLVVSKWNTHKPNPKWINVRNGTGRVSFRGKAESVEENAHQDQIRAG
jgi:hypothetical protein